jgi:hypothetical protein
MLKVGCAFVIAFFVGVLLSFGIMVAGLAVLNHLIS